MVPTYLSIVVFVPSVRSKHFCRWPLSQVLGLGLGLQGPVLGLRSCGLACISDYCCITFHFVVTSYKVCGSGEAEAVKTRE